MDMMKYNQTLRFGQMREKLKSFKSAVTFVDMGT